MRLSFGDESLQIIANSNSYEFRKYPVRMTPKELLEKYAAGVRDFRGVDLGEEVLSWLNLRGADLRGANLTGANLNWSDLTGADLRSANLTGADLNWTNLNQADLREANLSGASMSATALHGADWSGAIAPDGSILPRYDATEDPNPNFLYWLLKPFQDSTPLKDEG